MFLPFDLGEIRDIIELVYQVANLGWSNAHDAQRGYIEFLKDIETLAEQLENLHGVIRDSSARTGALLAPPPSSQTTRQLGQAFANFSETITDCRELLKSKEHFGTQRGPHLNIQWFLQVKDDVAMHRDRIAYLNTKLSLALKSLEIEARDGQTILVLECTDLILDSIRELNSRVSRAFGQPPPAQTAIRRLHIPQQLADTLGSTTAPRYCNLTSIPMAQGVDEVIFYLDRATQWPIRMGSTEHDHTFKLANVLRAYWLLQATKASEEYQAATNNISVDQFERYFPRLGMTPRRFFSKLEELFIAAQAFWNQRLILKDLRLRFSPGVVSSSNDIYPIEFSPAGTLEFTRLAFRGAEDLFEFQEWMTGFKVVDDYSRATITVQRASTFIGVDKHGNEGCVLAKPDPSRLVIFLPPPASDSQKKSFKTQALPPQRGSLLMIDIDEHIRINPFLCNCQLEAQAQQRQQQNPSDTMPISTRSSMVLLRTETAIVHTGQIPSTPAQPPPPPSNSEIRCKIVVLEVADASGMTVSEISETESDWNLAAAGRYQQEEKGLMRVKRLKKVTVEFGNFEGTLFVPQAMPYYPLPVPAHVIEEVDDEERRWAGDEEMERRAKNRAEIRDLWAPINAIYECGTPFFTKDAIRNLVRQIDESGVRRVQTEPLSLEFSIAGIDGRTVDISLQLGVKHPVPPHWPPQEDGSVLMDAMLSVDLRPGDRLTSIASIHVADFNPREAFLTMTVKVLPVPVLPATGEVVPQAPVRPAPETRAILQQEKAKWNAGAACRELVATFQGVADAGRLPRVDKVVAFACNCPSSLERAERVAAEHALVLSIRDFFVRLGPTTTVRWYAQDPVYQDVDREVLGELGMTVLDDPRGFLEVDESAVVFSLAPDVAVRQIVADIAKPALMIWSKVRPIPREGYWVGRAEQADNISPRVEEMIKDYTEFPFPSELAGFGSSLLRFLYYLIAFDLLV
ncbi:hypothetical protein VTI74DRAFT_10087 [Chaetomium olivicolor]